VASDAVEAQDEERDRDHDRPRALVNFDSMTTIATTPVATARLR
jgi:hypothetical protein